MAVSWADQLELKGLLLADRSEHGLVDLSVFLKENWTAAQLVTQKVSRLETPSEEQSCTACASAVPNLTQLVLDTTRLRPVT